MSFNWRVANVAHLLYSKTVCLSTEQVELESSQNRSKICSIPFLTLLKINHIGKVYSWGIGSNQQLGLGSEDDQILPQLLTGAQVKDRAVIKVSSGGQHTLFIAADKSTGKKVNGTADKPATTVTTKTNGNK